jgi:superfamily I DNA/RNA helicase
MKAVAIYGPPGTGKTHSMVWLCSKHAAHGPVWFLSFTKAAAIEAASRIKSEMVRPSTLHALAFRELSIAPGSVVDRRKLITFSKQVGIPISGADENTMDEQLEGDEYISAMSYANNTLRDLMEVYDERGRPGTIPRFEMFVKAYKAWKDTFGYIDFDDMLQYYAETENEMDHRVVFLDEAQDCSPLQWKAFNRVVQRSSHVYIAGDDDQAIFEWSGADPHGMRKFVETRAGRSDILAQSYRVPKVVHSFVHDNILSRIGDRVEKVFGPTANEGDIEFFGSPHEMDWHSIQGKDVMVLVRDRFRGLEIQRMLNADMIPYRMNGGSSPFDNRIAHSIRAIRKANAGEQVTGKELDALSHALNNAAIKKGDLSDVLGKQWQDVLHLTPDNMDFYEAADLDAPLTVTLSTIHQAKGREAQDVIVNVELPDRVLNTLTNDIGQDAERRVMYVAFTRTKNRVTVCGENPLI